MRRPFPAAGPETVQEMMSQSYHGHLDPAPARQQPALMTQSMVGPGPDSRQSIEHSLALIRHHVKVRSEGPNKFTGITNNVGEECLNCFSCRV